MGSDLRTSLPREPISGEPVPSPADSLRTGVWIYGVVGGAFFVVFFLVSGGPWKWLGGAIAGVCLLRALYYFLSLRFSRQTPPSSSPHTGERHSP